MPVTEALPRNTKHCTERHRRCHRLPGWWHINRYSVSSDHQATRRILQTRIPIVVPYRPVYPGTYRSTNVGIWASKAAQPLRCYCWIRHHLRRFMCSPSRRHDLCGGQLPTTCWRNNHYVDCVQKHFRFRLELFCSELAREGWFRKGMFTSAMKFRVDTILAGRRIQHSHRRVDLCDDDPNVHLWRTHSSMDQQVCGIV